MPATERISRYPLDALVVGATLTYDVRANYKVVLENYNECYHCAAVHPELVRLVPAFGRGGSDLDWDDGIPHREGAWTFTASGTSDRAPFPGLDADEQVRHKGELLYPNLMLSLSADHVAAFTLWPTSAGDRRASSATCCSRPTRSPSRAFDPSDAADFWDLVNKQDWAICESVQRGMSSRGFTQGWFAPMEDASLDIRRWLLPRLGEARHDRMPTVEVVDTSSSAPAGSAARPRGSWPGAGSMSCCSRSSASATSAARRTTPRGSCAAAITRRPTSRSPARRTSDWALLERESGEHLVTTTGGLDLFPPGCAIPADRLHDEHGRLRCAV